MDTRGTIAEKGWRARRVSSLVALLMAAVSLQAARAPESPCDPSLPVPKDDPYSYRQRGDRCEGRYIREVGATTLIVASFVESFAPLSRQQRQPLLLAWPKLPGAADVRVRAQGLTRRLYYRMDTRQSATLGRFAWPTDVLTTIVSRSEDLGILASTRVRVGSVERDVILPLRAGYSSASSPGTGYRAVILPGVQLSELFVTLSPLDPRGQLLPPVRSNVPLQYGYYPAERAIEIPIRFAELSAAGIYRMDVSARLDGGGTAATELYFFHRERAR